MPNQPIYIFDLGGVLIRLDVGRCMRAFEALMGEAKKQYPFFARYEIVK